RQHNERALSEREARLRAIAGAVPDILFVLDENGRYLEVMTHDEELLYRGVGSVLGRRLQDVLPEPVGARLMSALHQAIRSGAPALRPAASTRWTPRKDTASSRGASRPSPARKRPGRWCSSSRTSPIGPRSSRNGASPQSPSSRSRA